MDKYGVKSTHEAIKDRLVDYISTVYLGKNDALRAACIKELEKPGVLFQEPYIEANHAYLTVPDGIEKSTLPDDAKKILLEMCKRNLGVFANPYKHQMESLEKFYQGKDLFVSTGTGSGKTECFMWPMVSKLVLELIHAPETWNIRGVRAIMLYPMNALVSDQMGRLRKMIGNGEQGFHALLDALAPGARVPQFGMYTGRTPYPGECDEKQNKLYAKTIRKDILSQPDEVKTKLRDLGKYPSKYDLNDFVSSLEENNSVPTHPKDAELVTRQEMQMFCPDILITNYSMLEYMLIRPIEKTIWESTKQWLDSSAENRLLFVIDEAHMYRGSSGGEVALLIRRVLHKLGIGRDRVQFILTSASVPSDDEAVQKFACDLSAQINEKTTFEIIRGQDEEILLTAPEVDPTLLNDYNIDSLQKDWQEKREAVIDFARRVGFNEKRDFENERALEIWLYDNLSNCNPMRRIMRETRGKATSFKMLAAKTFPGVDETLAQKATSAFLAIAPLAKNKEGNVLYPARLHMLFRGLQGIYACSNPSCTCKNHDGTMGLGHIYLNKPGVRCKCGSLIYELFNEWSCGALFLRGFLDKTDSCNFVWNESGVQFTENLKEVFFYIIPDDVSFKKRANTVSCWLNTVTGQIDEFNEHYNDPLFLHIAYGTAEVSGRPDQWTFTLCPKCSKQHFFATDFSTKGNEPFFNLVSEQFYVQPPVSKYINEINQGRKVLLFSDSRQRAAVLARDLTKAADEDAMKKALTIAAKELQEWAEEKDIIPTLNLLYVFFLNVAREYKLSFFYGNNEQDLKNDLQKISELYKKKGDRLRFNKIADREFKHRPEQYNEHLLRQLCSNYRSLTDAGLCWIEPCVDEEDFDDLEQDLKEKVGISLQEFKILFSAWAMEIMTSEYAIGSDIDDSIRKSITRIRRLGLEEEKILPPRINNILKAHGLNSNQIKELADILKINFLTKNDISKHYYLNFNSITLKYDEHHEWFKCPRCGGIFPYKLWDKCAHCGEGTPKLMNPEDFKGVNFWRSPVLKAVHGDSQALMRRINTEEHTAQLSHKDQRQDTWSTTEDFEMRFQNVHINNDRPVDILSCTTTMEVGIDIGSLTAVGLRNIPPMRENYQQRAGRAGRKSAAISTILTFTDNRPHDSYYFHNPEKIISGDPRKPWIDVDNLKLVERHFNVMLMTEFFDYMGIGADKEGVQSFFNNSYSELLSFISQKTKSDFDMQSLVPERVDFNFEQYKSQIMNQIKTLKNKIAAFPEEYREDDNKEKTILDTFLEEGIFPSYSFPKDVVGFYIEDKTGSRIEQKPERSLEMAISEYAPGRIVVVNKETYKSGGIYNYHSKFRAGSQNQPARPYFESQDYFRPLYYCNNPACNWMGLTLHSSCPFCGNDSIVETNMLKPWGFAPIAGRKQTYSEDDAELTFAEAPCYNITPSEEEMIKLNKYDNLRFSKRSDEPLIILNKGPKSKGFMVCKDCGAAIPGDNADWLSKLLKPYKHPYRDYYCQHPNYVNTYLGNQFRTDLVVYEIALDAKLINVDASGLWIHRAGQTLAEAMNLAGGRLLDIEFNEIKSGYRLRYSNSLHKAFVDVFLFDSLSSGAGYCSALAERTEELLRETRKVLCECPSDCDSACHDCLLHYWNQRVHGKLDRFAALDLLNWCENSDLAKPLTYERQHDLLMPLNALGSDYFIKADGHKHYIESQGKMIEIIAYPDMWSRANSFIPFDVIAVSDKILQYALPKADSIIRDRL